MKYKTGFFSLKNATCIFVFFTALFFISNIVYAVIEVVESTNSLGYYSSIAIDSNDKVHISHHDYSNGNLRYCNNTNGGWSCNDIETVGNVGLYTSIAIDSNDKVHISHQKYVHLASELRYCTNAGGSWTCSTVDSLIDVGRHSSIAIDSNGKVHISHNSHIAPNAGLRYCTNAGGSWTCNEIDAAYRSGYYSSIAIDSNNKVHISHRYDDSSEKDLRYCTNAGGGWSCSTIDSIGDVGHYSSIAIDSNDKVHISYSDGGNRDLKYCNNLGGGFVCSAVETINSVGRSSSIAIDSENNVHISHSDSTNSDLRYCSTTDYSTWNCEIIHDLTSYDFGVYGGRGIAIKKGRIVDSTSFSNDIHLSYMDDASWDLYYAKLVNYAYSFYVSDCSVLSESGTYYLTQNILGSSTDHCIDITANNVILDCQGHTIEGDDVADYGIYIHRTFSETTNITLKNCVLTHWDTANVYLYHANDNNLENLNSTSSPDNGFHIYYSNSNNLTNITANSNVRGIYMEYSDSNNITNSTANSNNVGFYFVHSNFNTAKNNTANSCFESGFYISDSDSNIITRSTATSNTQHGFSFFSSSSNNLMDFTANSNNEYGIQISYDSDNNIIADSLIYNNTEGGLFLDKWGLNTPDENKIYNNLFNNSLKNIDVDGGMSNVNYLNTTKQTGLNIFDSNNPYIGGNYYTDLTGTGFSETCADLNTDGFCDNKRILTAIGNSVAEDHLPLSNKYTTALFIITSNTPLNETTSSDNTPNFDFATTGSKNYYSCELFIDNIGFGINDSVLNNTPTTITANPTLIDGTYDWYINCSFGGVTNQSEIREITITAPTPCTDEYDCNLCQKCILNTCTDQSSSEDLKNECPNYCDGSGSCTPLGAGDCGVTPDGKNISIASKYNISGLFKCEKINLSEYYSDCTGSETTIYWWNGTNWKKKIPIGCECNLNTECQSRFCYYGVCNEPINTYPTVLFINRTITAPKDFTIKNIIEINNTLNIDDVFDIEIGYDGTNEAHTIWQFSYIEGEQNDNEDKSAQYNIKANSVKRIMLVSKGIDDMTEGNLTVIVTSHTTGFSAEDTAKYTITTFDEMAYYLEKNTPDISSIGFVLIALFASTLNKKKKK
ncbi:MAG: right-handed parallel beta-helix repeat-containing protein [Candidatus Aenigmarchaeota archaeon]|nr:right-handed parallel beta-helix repeat-containing protein [Candidatus Aenigmarchaeota archaeon]